MVEEALPQDWQWLGQVIGPLNDDLSKLCWRSAEQMRPALDDVFC
ncbi:MULTISPECIES: hypothetical protein [unclassified Mesorhizobium]|nr:MULTISPECIES: hypothetical protein [unclassified Mesorhizobium]